MGSHSATAALERFAIAVLVGAVAIVASHRRAHAESEDEQTLLGEESGEDSCPRSNANNNDDPKRLTLLGVACFKAEEYARAYTYYHRAYQIEHSDLLRAAMGRSLHELGIFGPARGYYESFLEGRRGDESAEKIEKRLRQLREDIDSRGAAVRLTSFPSNVRVYAELPNGEWVRLGRTPTETPLRSGNYKFKFKLRSYRPRTVSRSVNPSSNPVEVDADLYHVETSFDVHGHGLKRAGFYTILGSIPVLATGGVFFGLSADKFAEAEDYTFEADYVPAEQNRMIEKGHTYQQLAIGFTAGGSAALITGLVLFLRGQAIESQTSKSSDPSAALRPVVSPRFVGVRGRF